jgi:hypothetical protein
MDDPAPSPHDATALTAGLIVSLAAAGAFGLGLEWSDPFSRGRNPPGYDVLARLRAVVNVGNLLPQYFVAAVFVGALWVGGPMQTLWGAWYDGKSVLAALRSDAWTLRRRAKHLAAMLGAIFVVTLGPLFLLGFVYFPFFFHLEIVIVYALYVALGVAGSMIAEHVSGIGGAVGPAPWGTARSTSLVRAAIRCTAYVLVFLLFVFALPQALAAAATGIASATSIGLLAVCGLLLVSWGVWRITIYVRRGR